MDTFADGGAPYASIFHDTCSLWSRIRVGLACWVLVISQRGKVALAEILFLVDHIIPLCVQGSKALIFNKHGATRFDGKG
jgi:hypothetical protein